MEGDGGGLTPQPEEVEKSASEGTDAAIVDDTFGELSKTVDTEAHAALDDLRKKTAAADTPEEAKAAAEAEAFAVNAVEALAEASTEDDVDEEPEPERRQMEFAGDISNILGRRRNGVLNTFCLGDKWEGLKTAEVDHMPETFDLVAVLSQDTKSTFGEGVAVCVRTGSLGQMLMQHAAMNFATQNIAMADDQIKALRQDLVKAYGRPVAPSEKCVVVYMAVCTDL